MEITCLFNEVKYSERTKFLLHKNSLGNFCHPRAFFRESLGLMRDLRFRVGMVDISSADPGVLLNNSDVNMLMLGSGTTGIIPSDNIQQIKSKQLGLFLPEWSKQLCLFLPEWLSCAK